ncbi:hypothetical protein GLE_2971 [Lysobacter enzymogenes]|uniref:Uncharacterized protein n=1 Tax=Lysobacter enzymogenes TaxID=69 RepID=A0A0S2DJ78_LYSEN|nr:hypothetical protein GLE_2971 [Lysobacter enzymogenes]
MKITVRACRMASVSNPPRPVVPAKAGIHFDFASPGNRHTAKATTKWIPAFAGMTGTRQVSAAISSRLARREHPPSPTSTCIIATHRPQDRP